MTTCGSRPSAKFSGSAINVRAPRYATSLAVSTAVAAGVLSGIVFFVLWAGWIGGIGILSVAGVFLAWFYKGNRPDLRPREVPRAGGGDDGKG